MSDRGVAVAARCQGVAGNEVAAVARLDRVAAGLVLAAGIVVDELHQVGGIGVAVVAGGDRVAGDLRAVIAAVLFARVADLDGVVARSGTRAPDRVIAAGRAAGEVRRWADR